MINSTDLSSTNNFPAGAYNFIETEKEILKYWEDNKFFKPETNPNNLPNRKTYTVILPPPNANGSLHVGHASGYTYQDMIGRYQRMNGKEVLLLPGKDHAGIQTEVVFEKELEKQGIKKAELGRDIFYQKCYEFCMSMSEIGRKQEKSFGLSADYERELFTLDPRVVKTVLDTFVRMFADKFVYKGSRIVNWCVRCQTTLADIDTDHKEREGNLWYVKYKIVDSDEYIQVATSRPETIMGDTALVVHPEDERYTSLIGKRAIVPIVNREIPIITTGRIDREFGTGVLKLTPAHAQDDWVIKEEWENQTGEKIPSINVIWKDGKLTGPIPAKYKGMKVNVAREEFVKELSELGLLEKTEKITQNIIICERCKSVIEPLISSQWFINVSDLKKVKDDVEIIPENMWDNFRRWMENLRDWPVSRQLWWGYRLPVWYKGIREEFVNEMGEVREMISNVELKAENFNDLVKVQLESPGEGWNQDPDVLDTWFSSGQWPYATLMAREGDFEKYYPTQLLETSYDILYLWVSRMVMLGQYRTGISPFEKVYLHGLITDDKGQKMSKSKGNGIDPAFMQEKYGTDALRWSLIKGSHAGQPTAMYEEKVKSARNFMNKIWNASRFVLEFAKSDIDFENLDLSKLEKDEQEMISHIEELKAKHEKLMNQFSFGYLSDVLYESFWFVFCDKYIENSKKKIGNFSEGEYVREDSDSADNIRAVLNYSLRVYLILLHPMIPFITEKVWQFTQKKQGSIMFENYLK